MRLINADALKEQVESHVVSMSVCLSMGEHYGKVTMREDCLQDIADATTIAAIPVEWIMKWSNKRYRETQRDVSIVDVLEAWQKEQEIRDESKV